MKSFVLGLTVTLIVNLSLAKAQTRLRETILWPALVATKTWNSSPFSVQVGLQNRYLNFGKRYQVAVGTAYLRYKIAKPEITLAAGYVSGDVATLGWVHLVQFYALKEFPQLALHPTIRITSDYLWFGSGQESGVVPPVPNNRYRVFLGVTPRLTEVVKLVATTEPFIYQHFGAFKEVRSTVGPRFKVTKVISTDVLYWHRWLNNGRIQLTEHALWFILRFSILSEAP